jgi:uncharacterized membrane protein HdeD (DUF308 family)
MRRLSLVLLPFLSAFALVFGLSYLWRGIILVRNGQTVAAGLFLVFGVVGIALAVSLWMTRKRARSTSNARGQSA